MKYIAFLALVALAACGADGAPEPKSSGVSISGTAKIGIKGSL
ncbi:MAG: hypothetical protein OIF48_00890 [Silicimonas sp.]|nr:hypothetical protein [Silicimonas sp.]